MYNEEIVDNKPSIRLGIQAEGQTGFIYLSSVWGSYHYHCKIELPENKIAQFFCPNCKQQIISENNCSICDAPMVPFILDMGGRVRVCSRSGCRDHSLEFKDVSQALNKLYQEYGFTRKYSEEELKIMNRDPVPREKKDDKTQEILESGAFLMSYCPNCRKSLIDHDILKLTITSNDEKGILLLSPYMNIFTSESTVFLQEDKPVQDISCPHCDTTLISVDKECGSCGSPVAKILISARTKMINFYICSKKGCKWHGLSDEDFQDIKLEDSLEW
ncbi:MAG: hypothetical protein D4R67_02675 [Bacteroidetes bacterium]|nr:MAG: hypothetical protein D4R67_02675 [Bacteroidota bacterium]